MTSVNSVNNACQYAVGQLILFHFFSEEAPAEWKYLRTSQADI